MSRSLLLVAAACFLISGCDSGSDQEKLQGDWKSREMWGWFEFDLPPTKGGPRTITFSGNKFTYKNGKGRDQSVTGTFSCDTRKSPREITFTFQKRTIVGIYSLSGNVLKICIGEKDRVPPTTFDGGPRERPALLLFQRPSEEDP
jgi:uncharacterized protein (TIGR03067 family)